MKTRDSRFSLSELVLNVADELRTADQQSRQANKSPILELKDCEFEVKVNISYEGKIGLKFWIAELGGGGKREDAHTIKLKFGAPTDPTVFAPGKLQLAVDHLLDKRLAELAAK